VVHLDKGNHTKGFIYIGGRKWGVAG